MPKRRRRRNRVPVLKPRRRRRKLMASKIGPWLRILGVLALIAVAVVLVIRLVVPPMLQMMGVEWPPSTPTPATPTPKPTPTPHPLTVLEPTQYLRDIDVSTNDLRFAADPYRYEDKIYFVAGRDPDGSAHFKALYEYDMVTGEQRALDDVQIQHDDVFRPQTNENWIVYLDHKRTGGGKIKVLDRSTNNISTVKTYYSGMPSIVLDGDLLAWMERTGTNMDKVFLFDLRTRENMTAAMLERSVFGQSDVDLSESEVIWADADPSATGEARDQTAVINYLSLLPSTESKKVQNYLPGTYVHDPKTNGTARVWTDQRSGPSPKLYLSLNQGPPEMVAEKVTGYDLGSDFVAYCADEVMYVYFWGTKGFQRQISLQGEKCIFAGVSNDTVFYYVTGGVSANDIIKYVLVNEIDANNAAPAVPTLNILTTPTPFSPTPSPVAAATGGAEEDGNGEQALD